MKSTTAYLTSLVLGVAISVSVTQGQAQNTLKYDSTAGSPSATINDVSWISGYWRGTAFGGLTEEVWTPPLGGSMMCSFKLVVDGKVKFYELVTIQEINQTLLLRLKHFHPDLKGWEDKNKTIDFPLVKVEKGSVYFDGFTFEHVSADKMNIYLTISHKDGTEEAMKFEYKKEGKF